MIFDIHTHTNLVDGLNSPPEVVKRAKAIGLDGIAITDHDEIAGSVVAQRYATKDFMVIPGLEFSAREGHILCLGTTDVPKRYLGTMRRPERQRPAAEILELIHNLGAIAIAVHPYDKFRRGVGDTVRELRFDAIEILNGHTLMNTKDPKQVAKEIGLPMVGGSDAHNIAEIGNIAIRFDGDPLESIRKGKVSVISKSRAHIMCDFVKSGIVKSYFKLK